MPRYDTGRPTVLAGHRPAAGRVVGRRTARHGVFFPDDLYAVDSTGSLLTAVVAVAALGVLIWQTVASEQRFVGGLDQPEGRDR